MMRTGRLIILGLSFLWIFGMYRCHSVQPVEDPQPETPAERAFTKGMAWRGSGDRDRAIVYFRKAVRQDSTFAEAWFRLAEMLDEKGHKPEMMHALDRYVSLEPDPPHAAYLKLGETAFELDAFGQALDYLNEIHTDSLSEEQRKKSNRLLRNSRFSLTAVQDTHDIHPEKLPPGINSPQHHEYWPVLLPDESAFYFTRRMDGNEEFFVSHRKANRWMEALPVDQLNTSRNEGAMALAPNGNWMVFTWCRAPNGWGRCDLYISFFRDSIWSEPINLGPEINSGGWESGPSIGGNGQTLYYASTKSGGKGQSDLYRAFWQQDNMWGAPEHLGDSINSPGKEQSPFLHPDGQTLYFRSNGWPGLGGFDLFVSRKKKDGGWTRPKNLGLPINTKGDEGSLFVALDGKTAYYATDGFGREGMPNSSIDIYTFELPEEVRATPSTYVRLHTLDADSLIPIGVQLRMIDLQTRDTVFSGYQAAGENSLFCVPAGHTYALHVTAPDYVFYSKHISLDEVHTAYEPIRDTVLMQKIFAVSDTARPTILQNVFFEYDESRLLPESRVELDQLYRFLKAQPDVLITIRGHTDKLGSEKYNRRLSEERAKAVYDYLIDSGIDPERLEYMGVGEKQPIADNETVEGRRKNRRTDFVIRRK